MFGGNTGHKPAIRVPDKVELRVTLDHEGIGQTECHGPGPIGSDT